MRFYQLRAAWAYQASAGLLGLPAVAAAQKRVLFVGDGCMHGRYAPVRNYNAAAATDENNGLPATSPRYESMASGPGWSHKLAIE